MSSTVVERWSLTDVGVVGKPSAVGLPTRPTQPFILLGMIND